MTPTLALLVFLAAAPSPAAARVDPLKQEAAAQHDALIREGFNLTQGITMGPGRGPFQMELLFPDAGERRIHFWMDAREGTGELRLVGPDGKPTARVSGRSGELDFTATFPAGSYRVELRTEGPGGRVALVGIQGGVVRPCSMDPARVTEIPAAPSAGFHWPYLLYLPSRPTAGHLLVAPNNTGFETEDLAVLRASASCQMARDAALAESLGAPLIVPLFPRPAATKKGGENLYLHALTRAALTSRVPRWRRVDLQLLSMVKDARTRLEARGARVDGQLLLFGFSASASFVNRFAVLHPSDVLAVACVSPGGWPLAPVAKVNGSLLPYPVGIAELPSLIGRSPSKAALERVRWLFLLGDQDDNDAVPYRDSFSAADQALVFRLFGKTPVARWKAAERLYVEHGLDARFALYPGAGHEVTPAMRADIERFLRGALAEGGTAPRHDAP